MKAGTILGLAVIAVGVYFLLRKKSVRAILDELFPGGFTASLAQLAVLESAGYPQGSDVYEEAIAIAYQDVSETCGPGQTVWWSGDLGYYCGEY